MATQIQALPVSRPLWRRALLPLSMLGILVLTYFVARALPLTPTPSPKPGTTACARRSTPFKIG